MHHIMTTPCILYQYAFQIGTCISYLKSENTKYTRWTGPQSVKLFIFLLLDLRQPDRKLDGFPIPNSHGLVGNVDWGESLAVVACNFPGLNKALGRELINQSCRAKLCWWYIFKSIWSSRNQSPLVVEDSLFQVLGCTLISFTIVNKENSSSNFVLSLFHVSLFDEYF